MQASNTTDTTTTQPAGHTPGPWHTGDAEWRSILGPKTRRYNDDGRLRLINIATVATSDDEAEDLANARLIACAPDMAESLAVVLEIAEDAATDDNWPTILRARAILARARGEGKGVAQ